MMTEQTEQVGLTFPETRELSAQARALYNLIFDYCTYSSDPQYKVLHKFRTKISKLEGRDRELLVKYFNSDPAINWSGMSSPPMEYYKDPY